MKPPATRLEPNYDIKMELKTNRYRHKSKLNYDIDRLESLEPMKIHIDRKFYVRNRRRIHRTIHVRNMEHDDDHHNHPPLAPSSTITFNYNFVFILITILCLYHLPSTYVHAQSSSSSSSSQAQSAIVRRLYYSSSSSSSPSPSSRSSSTSNSPYRSSYGSNNRSPVLHSSRGIAKVTPITIQPYVRLNQPNSVIPIPSAPTSSIGLTSTNGSTTSTTAPTSKPSIHNPLPIATVSAVISSVSASSAFGVNEPPLSSSVTNVQSSTTTTSTTTTTSFPIGSINKSGRNGKSIDQQYRTTTKSPNTATTTTTTTETSFVSSDEESNLCFLSNGGSSETFTVNEAMPIDSVIGSIKVCVYT